MACLRGPGLYAEIQAHSPPARHRVSREQGWDLATLPADHVHCSVWCTAWCPWPSACEEQLGLVPLGPTVSVAIELGYQEHSREA